jgi:hypothetical protein
LAPFLLISAHRSLALWSGDGQCMSENG